MVYREDLHFQFQGLVETLLLYLIYDISCLSYDIRTFRL